jgi:hypothetical protein
MGAGISLHDVSPLLQAFYVFFYYNHAPSFPSCILNLKLYLDMPFKRPAFRHDPSSGCSSGRSGDEFVPTKRPRVSKSAKIYPTVKVYIVQTKIDSTSVAELFMLAERHCQRLCGEVEDADVIITAITMRRRFERHVSMNVAVSIAIPIARFELDYFFPEIQSHCHSCLATRFCHGGEASEMRTICRAARFTGRDAKKLPHLRQISMRVRRHRRRK